MVKPCRLTVAPALVARLRDDSMPTAQDVVRVAQAIAGDLLGGPDHGLSLIYARVALFGDERP